jgi:choline dehydrogenase-like flavoprotein
MRDYTKLSCVGVVLPTGPTGTVGNDGRLYLSLSDQEFGVMKKGLTEAAGEMFRAGALRVHLGSKAPISFNSAQSANLEDLINRAVTDQGDLNLATAHPQGGNAISTNPDAGVVDGTFRVNGMKNLFVADASLFPTACGVNPMMTTLALAHMTADWVKQELS